jgi:outer membrane lipoprotein SlyB
MAGALNDPIDKTTRRTHMKLARPIALLAVAVSLGACADLAPSAYEPAPRVEQRIEYGVVDRIDLVREGGESTGVGTILGGLAGGVIGHQLGGGNGNTVATIAGALGGAYVGNNIEKSRTGDHYRIGVRLDSGARLELEEVGEGELRVGDRVRVVNGRVFRA